MRTVASVGAVCGVLALLLSAQAGEPGERPALKFARLDLERLKARHQPAVAEAEATLQKYKDAETALAAVRQVQAAAAGRLADVARDLPGAAALRAVAETRAMAAEAERAAFEREHADDSKGRDIRSRVAADTQAEAAGLAKRVAELEAVRDKATAEKAEADRQLTPLTAALAALDAPRKAADRALAAAKRDLEKAEARVAVYSQPNEPRVDAAAIREVAKFQANRPVMSCRIDPQGLVLLAGAQKNLLQRWDMVTGANSELAGHRSWIQPLAVLPDGHAVTGANEGKLIWWNALDPQAQPARTVDAHKGFVRAVSLSPDGRLLATSGNDRLVKIWNAADGTPVRELAGHAGHVYNVAWHPHGKMLYSGDLMGVVKQWDTSTWALVRDLDAKLLHKYDDTFKADCGGIRGMDFSPDGKWLACAGIGEVTNAFAGIGVPTVLLFDCETGQQVKVMKPSDNFQGTCWSVKFHPSGEFLVACGGGGGGALWFWKPGEEKAYSTYKLPNVGFDLSFHPDGVRLAVAVHDGTVRLYDLGPKK